MRITLFDVLGIDPSAPDRSGLAKGLWPINLVSFTQGLEISLSSSDESLAIVNMLQLGLTFQNVRPGVDSRASLGGGIGQIGFAADLAIGELATAQPFYLRELPDHGIQLIETDPLFPAQVWFAADGRGHEVVIERLPVKLLLKEGLVQALPPGVATVGTFDKTTIDSYAYKLSTGTDATEVDCFVRLHLTVEGDLILETAVPISFGPVRWMGLPATAVYDVQLLPSPNRRDYLEWAHNDVGSFFSKPPAKGAISFRSIDVDFAKPPFSGLRDRLRNGAIHVDNLELVLEDVAVPATVPVLPIPSHGTFGFRRKITDRTDIEQAYSLTGAPVQIPIYGSMRQGGSGGTSLTLEVEKFFFRTGDIHALDPADQPQVQFQAGLIFQTHSGDKLGPTMGIDDEWTITAGMVMDVGTTPLKFTIADTTVGLVGFKFGVSVGRLARGIEFKDSFELLGDLFITGKATGSDSSVFKMRSLTGKQLSIVIHDLGYKLGHFSVDGLQFPDGLQLIFANTVRIIIEELGWVEEANGTPYFSFSGGVALGFGGGNAVNPSGSDGDSKSNGFGIRVRRLRFRLNDEASQPVFKIDGVFLKLKYGTVDIEGFGYISDFTADSWTVKEWGFGVKVEFSAVAMTFSIAAMFIKGSRRQLGEPVQEFDYFLAALELGFLPAGPIGLYDVRLLVAYNFAPNLDAEFPEGEGVALLKWHQTHDNALTMPANRTLADWIPEKDSLAFGVGCGFSLNGCGSACHLDIFIFFSKSKAETGLLIVGDLFLLKNPNPIAFVAIEYDIDKEKFGVMLGVNIGLTDFAEGTAPSWLNDIARLSGTLYFGNKPWAFAIGQLADQSTWLALKLDWHIWLEVKFMIGLCVQIVDCGPKGFGIVLTLSAGADWGIGGFILWGSLGFIFGTWKTGSDSSGVEFWVELGFKINLFWIFSFGAEIKLRITYLGKHPWYITLHAEIRIDTPWFLPDVTFTIDKTWQEPMPFDTATITQCLSSAAAIDATAQSGVSLLVPSLVGALGDASFVYTFNQLSGLTGRRIGDPHVRDDIPVVSVDSTIAINLAQPSSNDSAIAGSTYDGTTDSGMQVVQDITVRYGLASIAVRRAPRFGATAGTWTDFVTDAETGFSIGGSAPQSLTFTWDADTRADGKLAPKRLLVNSASPYSFAIAGAQNDEEAVRRDPDFPCCDERTRRTTVPRPHVLEFSAIPFGARAPRSERFTNQGALWTWSTPAAPAVSPGDPVFPGLHVARFAPRVSQLAGAADLADPAVAATLELSWQSWPGILHFEGYDGLTLVAQGTADLHTTGTTTLGLSIGGIIGRKISRLVIRVDVDPGVDPSHRGTPALAASAVRQLPSTGVAIYRMTYITLADAIRYVAGEQRCDNNSDLGPPGSDAKGKLAFLPNHDYEVVVTETVAVGTKDQGTRTLTLSEALYFRTKGLPGLNACPNVGDDIRRHVDSTYPRKRAIPLYRQEPCVLAFENSLSSVLPIDRTPAAGDPPEKAQMFPLELNIDRIVSLEGLKRLTVPSNDWIAAHRANPYPPIYYVAFPVFAKSTVRVARSSDPLVLRYEAVKLAVPTCGMPNLDHASQVLLHEPIDVSGAPGPWEAATGYRATVRQGAGPFTERSEFDSYDLGAFVRQADGGASAVLWSVDGEHNVVAPAAAGGRHYAACGELDWDHLQAHARIDLRAASAAGIAVGVGDGAPVPRAILATVEVYGGGHALVVRARDGAGERELGRAAVTITGPFLLGVVAYDDVVRATVGEVSVDGVRGAIREGRVALVSHGPAAFAGISVGALDIYAFDFVTSKFAGFGEHMASYDGTLPVLAASALGGTPAPIASVLADHAADLAAVMQASADPQERQRTFDAVVTALGIGLRNSPLTVGISRLTGATGTFGLLIESPEPIAFTRDVALTMTRHVQVWIPGSLPLPHPVPVLIPRPLPPRPGPRQPRPAVPARPMPRRPWPAAQPIAGYGPIDAAVAAGLASRTAAGSARTAAVDPAKLSRALEAITFGAGKLSLPRELAVFGDGDRIARVVEAPDGARAEIYDAPRPGTAQIAEAKLRERLTIKQAQRDPALVALIKLGVGVVGVVHPGGLGPILFGHWVEFDVAVPFVVLSNGSETAILVLSSGGAPLLAGKYSLHFVLDRDRWSAVVAADPEQHYHDEHAIALAW